MSVGTLTHELRADAATARGRVRTLVSPLALVVALTVLAAVLRFVGIGHQGFWFDEANTAGDVHFSLGKMLGLLPQNETTPPLFYCVAWAWARVFGYGEAGLRSLSALFGIATVPVAYAACAKLVSRRAGLIAAALVACNPMLIWYSQEFRPYELLVLLSGLGLLGFLYAREDPTPRWLALWAIASGLALATHYYALLMVVPEALWLLALHRRDRRVQAAFAIVGLCGAALLPLAISQNHTGNASWIVSRSLPFRLGQIPPQFLVGTGAPAAAWLRLAAGLALGLAAMLILRRTNARERGGIALAAAFVVGGLALNLVMVAAGVDDVITRNLLALWLPALFVVAGGFGARRAGVAGLLGAAVFCSVGVAAAIGVAVDRKLERPDWRAVAHAIGPRPLAVSGALPAQQAGRAVLVQHYRNLLPLSLYMPGLRFVKGRGARVSELDVISISSPRDPFCWWGAACNLIPSPTPGSFPIPGFSVSGPVEHIHQFSLLRLRAAKPTFLTPHMVARALTTTPYGWDELLVQPPA